MGDLERSPNGINRSDKIISPNRLQYYTSLSTQQTLLIVFAKENTYILLDVLLCSIAEYFYDLCRILTSP